MWRKPCRTERVPRMLQARSTHTTLSRPLADGNAIGGLDCRQRPNLRSAGWRCGLHIPFTTAHGLGPPIACRISSQTDEQGRLPCRAWCDCRPYGCRLAVRASAQRHWLGDHTGGHGRRRAETVMPRPWHDRLPTAGRFRATPLIPKSASGLIAAAHAVGSCPVRLQLTTGPRLN